MPVESEADRASMFDDGEFGTAALYTPPAGSPSSECTIIFEQGPRDGDRFEVGPGSRSGMRAALADYGALISADEVPEVAQGGQLRLGARISGVFVPGSVVYRIEGEPDRDESGQIWTVALSKVA